MVWWSLLLILCLVSCGRQTDEISNDRVSPAGVKTPRESSAKPFKPSRTFVSSDGRATNLVYLSRFETYRWLEPLGVVELERQLEREPGNADLWYRLGMVWQSQLYDMSNAQVCFEHAAELAPDALQPRLSLLGCYMAQGTSEKILETFMEARVCVANEQQRLSLMQIAMQLQQQGHVSEAFLKEQFDTDDSIAYLVKANCAVREKEYAAAVQYATRGYELTTNSMIRAYLASIGWRLQKAQRCDREVMERFFQVLFSNMPASLRVLYDPTAKQAQFTADTPIEKLNEALALAVSADEQWEIARLVYENPRPYAFRDTAPLKTFLDTIVGTNMPPRKRMFEALRMYTQAGLTNRLVEIITTYAGDRSTSYRDLQQILYYIRDAGNGMGREGHFYGRSAAHPLQEQMDAVLARIIERCPSNGMMLNVVADEYALNNCLREELETRERGLACEDIPEHIRAAMAAKLLAAYIHEDMAEKAQALMTQHAALARTYQAFAKACAEVYCGQNDTNAAWEMLRSCATGSRFAKERIGAAGALLDYRWDDRSKVEWIADAIVDEMKKAENPGRLLNAINGPQRRAFIDIMTQLGRESVMADIVEDCFLRGSPWLAQELMPKSLDAEAFEALVHRVEQAGKTSLYTYSSLVQFSHNLGFGAIELKLRLKALESERDIRSSINVQEALQLAVKLQDAAACEKLVTLIEQKPGVSSDINTLVQFYGAALQTGGMQQRFDRLLQACITNQTVLPYEYTAQQLMKWGKTNVLETLFDTVIRRADVPVEQQYTLLKIAVQLNKTDCIPMITGTMAAALTNTVAISRYGAQYLEALSRLARTDASYAGQRDTLITEWMADTALSVSVRYQFMQSMPNDSHAYRDMMLGLLQENPPEQVASQIQYSLLGYYRNSGDKEGLGALADTMLADQGLPNSMRQNLVHVFSNAGMPDRALELCERVMALSTDDYEKKSAMITAMQLCVQLEAPERALVYADQLAAALRPGNVQEAGSIISIYQQAGKSDKALKLCLASMRMTSDAQQLQQLASNLKNLARNNAEDVADACRAIITELAAQGCTPERLAVMASLADMAGDQDGAFRYLEDAIRQTDHPDRQSQYYRQLADMCRDNQMPAKEIEVLEQSINILEPRQQGKAVHRIVSLLQQQKRYEEAIARGNEFMASPVFATLDDYSRDSLIQPMITACMEVSDNEQAWNLMQKISTMYSYLGYAFQLNRLDDALPRIEQHLDSDAPVNDKINVMRDLLNYCRRNNRTAEIEATISRLDRMLDAPLPADLLPTVADMYERAGQPDKAIDYLMQRYTEVQGENRERMVTSLARTLQNNKRADEALVLLTAEPQTMTILETKARLLYSTKEYSAAAEAYLAAIDSVPVKETWRVDNYMRELANMAGNCNDEELTGKILARVLEKKDATAYENAATVYERLQKYDDAAQCLANTIELTTEPDKKQAAQQRLANCSVQAGNYDDAIETYAELMKTENIAWQERVTYQERLADIYRKTDKPNAARDVLREAVRECDRAIKGLENKADAADVYLRKAGLYRTMGDPSARRDTLQYIVDHFHGTPQAEQAKQQLERQ